MDSENKKILVIDDDRDAVEAIKIVLETKGYQIIPVYNDNEGLQRVAEEKPDLIILDVVMTEVDSGFRLCKKLKENEITKNIPIIILTAINEITGFEFSSERAGCWLPTDDYIDKPVQPGDLIKRVEKLLIPKASGI